MKNICDYNEVFNTSSFLSIFKTNFNFVVVDACISTRNMKEPKNQTSTRFTIPFLVFFARSF